MLNSRASDFVASFGRACFGAALIGFAALQFVFGDFVVGRAPAWPNDWPGRVVFAGVTGFLFAAAGLAIATRHKAREGAIVAGALILVWALSRNFRALAAAPNPMTLTAFGKALALCGGAFVLAIDGPPAGSWSDSRRRLLLRVGAFSLGFFLVVGGTMHFVYPAFAAQLIPSWIPAPMFWTYFGGTALIAGGVGMNVRRTRLLAPLLSGVMILSWVFLLHAPRAFAAATEARRNEWTAVFEALAFAGAALFIAGRADRADRADGRGDDRARLAPTESERP
jgi:hypothetical protein